jgi:glycosyltransferase involved in cell wall biosynthesis
MQLSVVIPVFNNAETIHTLAEQIFLTRNEAYPSDLIELILVDDGSTDGSWAMICQVVEKYQPECVGIRLSRNFGQLGAIIAGTSHSNGDAVINMSADLQDPTSLIAEMVSRFKLGDELVIAFRESRLDGKMARFTSQIAYFFARRSMNGFPKGGFDFTLMSRRLKDHVLDFKGNFRFLQSDMLNVGFRRSYIPYVRLARPSGNSGYTFSKRLKVFVDMLLDGSYTIILSISRLGIFVALCGLIYALTIVAGRFLFGSQIPGWAPMMIILVVNTGLIMTMLGLIAEYQWRIYDHLRNKPLFIIEAIRDGTSSQYDGVI